MFCTGCVVCGCVEFGCELCALCEGYCLTQCTQLAAKHHTTTASNQCTTPYEVIHNLVLLKMGIMMPETCWDRSLIINTRLVASCLVYLSSNYGKSVSGCHRKSNSGVYGIIVSYGVTGHQIKKLCSVWQGRFNAAELWVTQKWLWCKDHRPPQVPPQATWLMYCYIKFELPQFRS